IRRSVPGAMHDQELVLEEERLRNYGTGAARSEQAGQGSDEVDEKNDQIAHHRIVAGQGILRNLVRNNNSPATGGTPEEISSVAPGRADLWRGLAVSPGTNPVHESEGEEPRICAVIPVGLAALSGT